jgi:hypothetical protein
MRNPNPNGRPPPPNMNETDPEVAAELTHPDFLYRLANAVRAGRISPTKAQDILTEMRQHRRAINGDRALPGDYNGRDDLPYLPMPFAIKDEFRPDRVPGTKAYTVLRQAVENADAAVLREGLAAQMREHDPSNSTWARSAPSEARAARAAQPEPTLRESIQASMTALGHPTKE